MTTNAKKLKVGAKVHIVSGPLSGSGGKVVRIQGGLLWFVCFGAKVCFLVSRVVLFDEIT